MKYLKLYEAFESSALSNSIKYLTNKVDKDSVNRFRNRLLKVQEQLDIPISKISDKDVKYLNRNQALKLRSDKNSENPRGIYCLKFWFSLNEGYIGFTSTGNQVYKFEERRRRSYDEKYSDEEVDYIKNNLGIKTGNLRPIKNYDTDLKHGSFVIGIFSDDIDDETRMALAKIWRNDDNTWAIQNVASGGSPDYEVNGEHWTNWRNDNTFGEGRFTISWSLDSVHSPGDDHHKLYLYTPSEEPLTIEGYQKPDKEEREENPLDYNLPTNSRLQAGNWFNYDWSINSYEDLKRADFAIVLILEDLFKLKTVSSINKERKESKEGASKFLSDDTIRRMNIERYLTALVGKMGIKTDIEELKNLQKLILKSICNEFGFISIYKSRPSFDYLENISGYLYDMIRKESKEDKEHYLSRIISSFKSLNDYSEDYRKTYTECLGYINNSGLELVIELFNLFIEIGKKINDYLLSQNVQTIEDLKMIVTKLKSIRSLVGEKEFQFSGYTRSILNDFHYTSDVKYWINDYSERRNNDILEDIKKAKNIKRYVQSILR